MCFKEFPSVREVIRSMPRKSLLGLVNSCLKILGKQISPNPIPKGVTNTPGDGDFNKEKFYNYGSILINKEFSNNPTGDFNNVGTLTNGLGGKFGNDFDGLISNYGHIENDSFFDNAGFLANFGDIRNQGSLNLGKSINTGSILNLGGGYMDNEDRVENYGALVNEGNGVIMNGLDGKIENHETVFNQKDARLINIGVFINQQDGQIFNNGKIDTSGNEQGANGFVNNGTITGSGVIDGSWIDHGHIKPGNSAGGNVINGSLLKDGGSIQFELGGESDANRDRLGSEHDFVDITGDLIIHGGELDVALIENFKIQQNQEFIITKLDGELTGHYDGLKEGASIGKFESIHGFKIDLHISYAAGDGNDISLYTEPLTNPEIIFGYL